MRSQKRPLPFLDLVERSLLLTSLHVGVEAHLEKADRPFPHLLHSSTGAAYRALRFQILQQQSRYEARSHLQLGNTALFLLF